MPWTQINQHPEEKQQTDKSDSLATKWDMVS